MELNNVRLDALDEIMLQQMQKEYPAIDRAVKNGEERLRAFEPLAQDVVGSLYKVTPELTAETPRGTELNRREVEAMHESSIYREMHENTMLDNLATAIAADGILSEMTERLATKEMQEAARQQDELQELQERLDELREIDISKGDPLPEAVKQIEEAQAKVEAAQQTMQQTVESIAGASRRAMQAGLDKGNKELEKAQELADQLGWSLFGDGEMSRTSLENKLSLLKRAQKLKDKARLIGRMRQIAASTRKTTLEYERVELHGIECGDDLNHLLQSELVMYDDPETCDEFLRRYVEKQSLQYELNHKEKTGRGPIICLIDESGSMCGTRDDYAKASAFGLAEVARTESRDFAWCRFSGSGSMHTDEAKGGKMTIEQQEALLTTFLGGGTDYEGPLNWATTKINESKYEKADIVLITDGDCQISSKFAAHIAKIRDEKHFRVWIIYVDKGMDGGKLHPWADGHWSDLFDPEVQKEVYSKL